MIVQNLRGVNILEAFDQLIGRYVQQSLTRCASLLFVTNSSLRQTGSARKTCEGLPLTNFLVGEMIPPINSAYPGINTLVLRTLGD